MNPRDVMQKIIDSAVTFPADAALLENESEVDHHRNAPKPDPACLYGLVGDVARAGGDTTEANHYAVAANFIAYLSCAVGRGPYMSVGNTWHHARQFVMHVGRSGRGRKGDAVSLVKRINMAVLKLNEHSAPQVHSGGLSSREGLIYLIHDGFREGKKEFEPIWDKRLWVIESEFANVLHQSKREGNTLSAALRDLWDGVDMKPATKTNRLFASNPHVSLTGAITPNELLDLMASREMSNGFANRFLIIWAERQKLLPFPKATPQDVVDKLAERVLEVLDFCRAAEWVERDHTRIELAPEAAKRWTSLYRGELNDHSAGERLNAMLERRAPILLRLAMLFALTDLKTKVEEQHINAALAWVRYAVDSVKFIFATANDEVETRETNETAEKIVQFLKQKGKASRKEITQDCFKGHTHKTRIDAALDELLTATPPRITVESVPRPKGLPGSPTKIYRVSSANSANSANRDGFQRLELNSQISELCELSTQPPWIDSPTVRTVSTVRTT